MNREHLRCLVDRMASPSRTMITRIIIRLLRSHDLSQKRHLCVWCGEPDRWPDLCHELLDRCTGMIEFQCGLGDHRRCSLSACVVAARWHEPVRRAGVAAARAIGATWAVVSTIENEVTVVDTAHDLDHAKSVLRNKALQQAGIPPGPEGPGLVYIVRGSDGGLF